MGSAEGKGEVHQSLIMKQLPGIVYAIFLVLISSCSEEDPKPISEKLNIIFILTDDLDFDEINTYDSELFPCYYKDRLEGKDLNSNHLTFHSPEFFTPTIDRLANEGVVFNHYYVSSGVCTASRYTILSGKHPHQNQYDNIASNANGNLAWEVFLHPEEDNIARMFSRQSYQTAYFGKWHSGFNGQVLPFSAWEESDSAISGEIESKYQDIVGYIESSIGFDHAERLMVNNYNNGNIDWISEGVQGYIENAGSDPFFIYASLPLPHAQFYEIDKINTLHTTSGVLESVPEPRYNKTWAIGQNGSRYYEPRKNMATWIDGFLKGIIESLESKNLLSNTLIVFTSDHQTRGKMSVYEGCRVPMIMWNPSILEPGKYNGRMSSIDLIPTLTELSGNQMPAGLPGESQKQSILGKENESQKPIYLTNGYLRAVVWKDYKYILNLRPETSSGFEYNNAEIFPHFKDHVQLYDLKNDASEQVNLVEDPSYSTLIAEMDSLLQTFLRE